MVAIVGIPAAAKGKIGFLPVVVKRVCKPVKVVYQPFLINKVGSENGIVSDNRVFKLVVSKIPSGFKIFVISASTGIMSGNVKIEVCV